MPQPRRRLPCAPRRLPISERIFRSARIFADHSRCSNTPPCASIVGLFRAASQRQESITKRLNEYLVLGSVTSTFRSNDHEQSQSACVTLSRIRSVNQPLGLLG